MIKYLKVYYDETNRTQKSFWYLEIDTETEKVLREIETDINDKIIRKAPTKEDNYGVFTDNLDVVISPQIPRHKETIIFDLVDKNIHEISKEEFEKNWLQKYISKKRKSKITKIVVMMFILLLSIFIYLFVEFLF